MTKRGFWYLIGLAAVAAAAFAASPAQASHRGEPQCIGGYCNNASGSYATAGPSFTGNVTVSQQLPSFGLWCATLTGYWLSPNFGGIPQSQTYNSDPSTCNNITTNPTRSFSFSGIDGGTNFYEGAAIAWEWIGGPSPWRPYFLNTPTFSIPLPAPTVSFCCSTTVTAGTPVTFTMTVSGTATSCNASGYWSGAVSTTGDSVTITPPVPGTYSESVQCNNSAGPGNTASVSITANPPPPPAPSSGGVTPDIDPGAPGVQQRHGDTTTAMWNDVAGATTYNLYVVPSGGATSVCAAGCPLAQGAVCAGGTCAITGPNHVGYSVGNFTVYVTACNASGCSGPSPTVSVTVQSNNAAFVSQDIPNTVRPGETFTARVTFRNTGESTWDTPGQYVLRSEVSSFEVALPAVVLPSQTVTFSGPLRIDSSGTYPYRWRMYRRENNFGFFGQSGPDSTIRVTGPVSAEPIRVQLRIRAKQNLPIQ